MQTKWIKLDLASISIFTVLVKIHLQFTNKSVVAVCDSDDNTIKNMSFGIVIDIASGKAIFIFPWSFFIPFSHFCSCMVVNGPGIQGSTGVKWTILAKSP